MNPASFSVKRPVFTTMVTLIVVVLGLVALRQLRVDLLPEVELPRLTIRTSYEGASPEVMEQLVSQTIEQIVSIVPGVEEITSVSAEGNSTVRVTFGWGVDIDIAAQDVTSTLENSANDLPDNASRPRVSKFDIARFPVVLLGISSHLDPVELTELIDNQIFNRFSSLPGVAQADLWGGYQREVRIALDAERVKALGLPLNNVLAAIRNANLDLPAGRIEQGQYDVILRAPAQFRTVEEIGETVVAVREGAPIALNQIADVEDTHQRLTRIIRVNGERGLRMAIRKPRSPLTRMIRVSL